MIKKIFLTCRLLLNSIFFTYAVDAWIRINQVGYMPDGEKKAVLISESALNIDNFIEKLQNLLNFTIIF